MPTSAPKHSAKASPDATKAPSRRRPRTQSIPDAIQLLIADHKEVKGLFKTYDKLVNTGGAPSEKLAVATEICERLTAHATAEEELFYPAAREVLGENEDLVDEADVEHASAKTLISQIQAGTPGDPLYDAKVRVLGEYIDHHVSEEEGQIFPKVRKTDLDLETLGEELAARKAELMGRPGDTPLTQQLLSGNRCIDPRRLQCVFPGFQQIPRAVGPTRRTLSRPLPAPRRSPRPADRRPGCFRPPARVS